MTNLPIQWGKHVTGIEHNDQGVSLKFKDGTNAKGDIMVGADGVHSVGKYISLTSPGSLSNRVS
jgi:2-polyprenyl-6-methoxyphenol hydroxylase-like FAD-dependent oxidoreductase